MRKRKLPTTPTEEHAVPAPSVDLTMTYGIEVASVKAQAQSVTRRLKAALNDIYGEVEELEEIVDHLPVEGVGDDDVPRPRAEDDAEPPG